ncbi:SprT-like domain-containing protein [Cytobacillus firmus]|nr:SprT-like domain-containing protein [Cytobacillus firmus]
MSKNLQPTITELHRVFDLYNKHFFSGKLPEVVIAIRSQGKRKGVLGWFSVGKVWEDGQGQEKHEIVITAETLKRDYMDIIQTLAHEMIHLHCSENDIKDTSRNGAYHNKTFRDEACKYGFEHLNDKPDSKIGWSFITLTDETKQIVDSWKINKEAFGVARKSFGEGKEKKKKKSNIIKWTCPSCGCVIRSSKLQGVKPYCMNDDDGQKEPCAAFFEPEIPEGFIGKGLEPEPQPEPETPEGFTENEWNVVEMLMDMLKGNEVGYADVMYEDLLAYCGWQERTLKGVLGSLIKKEYVLAMDVNGEYNVYGLTDKFREEFAWSEDVA